MRDVFNPLIDVYFNAIEALGYPTYEGEEPNNEDVAIYIVIGDPTSNDASTKNSSDVTASIQVTINSYREGVSNSEALNTASGLVLQAIKPTPNAVLDLSPYNMQMLNLSHSDGPGINYGRLDGRVYISRQIIFKQDIFIY